MRLWDIFGSFSEKHMAHKAGGKDRSVIALRELGCIPDSPCCSFLDHALGLNVPSR